MPYFHIQNSFKLTRTGTKAPKPLQWYPMVSSLLIMKQILPLILSYLFNGNSEGSIGHTLIWPFCVRIYGEIVLRISIQIILTNQVSLKKQIPTNCFTVAWTLLNLTKKKHVLMLLLQGLTEPKFLIVNNRISRVFDKVQTCLIPIEQDSKNTHFAEDKEY